MGVSFFKTRRRTIKAWASSVINGGNHNLVRWKYWKFTLLFHCMVETLSTTEGGLLFFRYEALRFHSFHQRSFVRRVGAGSYRVQSLCQQQPGKRSIEVFQGVVQDMGVRIVGNRSDRRRRLVPKSADPRQQNSLISFNRRATHRFPELPEQIRAFRFKPAKML